MEQFANFIYDFFDYAMYLGILYPLARLIYLSNRTSFYFEIKEIIAFKYFFPIKIGERDQGKDRLIKKIFNVILVVLYIIVFICMIFAIIRILYESL